MLDDARHQAVDGLNQRTRQHQLVVRTSHDLRPAFGLFSSTQARLIPKEYLSVQSETMLLGVAQTIVRTDFAQGSGFIAFPDKPTDLRVTRTAFGSVTDDLDLASLTQM